MHNCFFFHFSHFFNIISILIRYSACIDISKVIQSTQITHCLYRREEIFNRIFLCPFICGCVNGGGQPFTNGDYEKVKARGAGLYVIDKNKSQRKSHENEDIKKLYDEFLGERGGHNAHKYLHTHYFDKSNPYSKKNDVSLQTN